MNTTPLKASGWADRAEVAFPEHREEAHARQGRHRRGIGIEYRHLLTQYGASLDWFPRRNRLRSSQFITREESFSAMVAKTIEKMTMTVPIALIVGSIPV